jgi:hypothetical protein
MAMGGIAGLYMLIRRLLKGGKEEKQPARTVDSKWLTWFSDKPKGPLIYFIVSVFVGVSLTFFLMNTGRGGPETARRQLAEMNIPFNERVFFERIKVGDVVIVELFIKAGLSPNFKDKEGYTALMRAAQQGHSSIIRTLLKHGAGINITGGNFPAALSDLTALDIAEVWDQQEAAEILKKGGGFTGMDLLNQRYPAISSPQKKQEGFNPNLRGDIPPDLYEIIRKTESDFSPEEREAQRSIKLHLERQRRQSNQNLSGKN